jgi:hypothetical protein
MWSARISTLLSPTSIMQTAAISPNSLWLLGDPPLIAGGDVAGGDPALLRPRSW